MNGEPKFISAIFQPHGANLKCTFDTDWNPLEFITSLPRYDGKIEKPSKFDSMLEMAKKLSTDVTFLRVDFMMFDEKIYFGELTKYPASGFIKWKPSEMDEKIGKMIEL